MIIDGKKYAEQIIEQTKQLVSELPMVPTLAVVSVGDDVASEVYVRNKLRVCTKAGIHAQHHHFDKYTSASTIKNFISMLNADPKVNGIILQLPLPNLLKDDTQSLIEAIDPLKDVDGLTPSSVYANYHNLSFNAPTPCTPFGILFALLDIFPSGLDGKNVLIFGRSQIVGKPLAHLLTNNNATVTLLHSKSLYNEDLIKRADIIISAIGVPNSIPKNLISHDAVLIDVGIFRDENGKLRGDFEFDELEPHVSAITPVPGGVGPMTTAAVAFNTALCANYQITEKSKQ